VQIGLSVFELRTLSFVFLLIDHNKLDAQAAAAPPVPPAPTPIAKIKIATLYAYDGTSDHTEHFLHQCKVYFLITPGLMAQQHIMFVLSYVSKGHVLLWAEQTMEVITHPGYFDDWGVFKDNIRNSFGDTMVHLEIKEVE
jgi:hypothetical protein